jgi:sugar/nucleoside kinase (ribokinase family)
MSTGGPASNTGLALHKLGITTQLMGKVGADLFGRAVQDILRSYGEHLTAGIVVDERTSTSYSLIVSPSGEDRTFLHHAGGNATFCAEDVQYRQVGEADLFHFGYPPLMRHMYESDGAELAQVFLRAKATGVTTALDMAFPDPASPAGCADWKAILRATLPFVEIFMPSIEELLFMLRRETFDQLLRAAGGDLLGHITPELVTDVGAELLGMGVKVLVLKLGERGLYLRSSPPSRVFTLWLSITAADGCASRPSACRTALTSATLSASQVPSRRQRQNWV